MNELTHLDLFSGIGGFSLGAERAGFKTIGFAEIDAFASAVLRKHWPAVVNYGDVRSVPAVRCTVLSGGFPCQPFSIAGKQGGYADNRNQWPAMLECIKRSQPDWVLGENVVNIANMVLSTCQDDLEKLGYQSKAFDVSACAVGLPTMERHVWIVAARHGVGIPRNTASDSQEWPCLHEWDHGRTQAEFERRNLSSPKLLRSRKGFPGFMDRIRCIGNAVSPQTAEVFFRAIAAQYQP